MTRSDAFWGHVVHDTKGLANQLLSKIKTRKSFEDERTHNGHHQSQPRYPYSSNRSSSSNSLVSLQDDDHDTLAMSIDLQQPLHFHQGYSSLWEVQLELGEIPNMISNNLLTPCDEHPSRAEGGFFFSHSPSSRPTLHDLVDERGGIDRVAMTRFDQVEEEEEEELKEGGEDSAPSDPLVLVGLLSSLPYVSFTNLMGESSTGACLRLSSLDEQEYGDGDSEEDSRCSKEDDDQDENDDDEASEKNEGCRVLLLPSNHPIYGMIGAIGEEGDGAEIDQVGNELFKHGRKDSGVFLQEENTCVVVKPLDILRLLAVVQAADDQWH